MNKIEKQVSGAQFVIEFTQALNNKDTVILYFVTLFGMLIKILEIRSHPGETAEIISQLLQMFFKKACTDKTFWRTEW